MTRSRMDAGLRREEILRATAVLIEEAGIQALRISDVAQALRVSPALVVYHFRSKEELIAEAFTWAAQRDLDRLEKLTVGLPTPIERFGTALAWYAPTGQAKGWKLWIEAWAAALREPKLRQVGREVDLRWKDSLAAIIQDGVEAGEFSCADPRGAAWRITAVLDGLAVQALVHQGAQGRERMGEWARQIVAREVGVDPSVLAAPRATRAEHAALTTLHPLNTQ